MSRPHNSDPSQGFAAVVSAAAANPKRVAIFSDFDGTLSNLIDNPDAVTPVDGAVEVVTSLAEVSGRVAIVSGRPVSFLQRFFGAPIQLSGLYGIEHHSGSRLHIDPTAKQWADTLAEVAAQATDCFGKGVVEDKTYSLTLHYRNLSEDLGVSVVEWCKNQAAHRGLHARDAKQSVEIHPPIDRDKGDAIESMLDGMTAAVYFGDDVGDRSAFERLDQLLASGRLDAAAAVLINGSETPEELLAATTDEATSPSEAVGLLRELLAAASGS